MASVLTNVGRAIVTGSLKRVSTGIGSAEPKWLAIGTGAGTAAATDTALFTEVGSRVSGTTSQTTVTNTNDSYSIVGTITVASTTGITNAGCFDASSASNLFVHGDFPVINLAAGDSIALTISLTML